MSDDMCVVAYELSNSDGETILVTELVRQSDALAKLAEKDAEIARLRDVLSLFTAYESLMDDGECAAAVSAYANFQLKVHEALKGPEA